MAYNQPYGMPYGYQNYPYGNIQPQQPVYQQPNQQMQQQQTPQQQPQYSNNFYSVVNGLEGAKQYPVLANQTMLLMDSNKPIVYKKSANGLGQTTIECFKLVSITEQEINGNSQKQDEPKVEYASREEFNALKTRFDSLVDKLTNSQRKNENRGNSVQNKGSE
jgi:hypothetical protein